MNPLLSLLLPLFGALQAPTPSTSARVERRVAAMGTLLTLEVTAESRSLALRASEAALEAVEQAEGRLSTWQPETELSRLCAAPVGEPFRVSSLLARDLERALHWRAETSAAFSPTARPLIEAWGLREGGRAPSDEQLARALEASSHDALRFELPAVTRLNQAAGIEEGGFGKGVGLDDAGAALLAAGAQGAFLDFGGQTLLVGATAPTFTALAHPDDRSLGVVRLELLSGSSATSGNSERGIEVDGIRLGHVLDPRSGRPAPDFGSLTVLAPSATDADCLSTALYVLGPEAALSFAEARPGIEVVILERLDDRLRVHATSGLRGRLVPLISDLEVSWSSPSSSTPHPVPATAPHPQSE